MQLTGSRTGSRRLSRSPRCTETLIHCCYCCSTLVRNSGIRPSDLSEQVARFLSGAEYAFAVGR